MSDARKDTWGKWGIIIPLAVMAFASLLFAAIGNIILGFLMGIGNPFNFFFIALYSVLALAAGLVVVWATRARQRWLESMTDGS